jgi:hypothetical protein
MRPTFTASFAALTLLVASQAAAGATSCDSVAACVLGNNTGTGVGLEGVSQQNVGVYGVSTANHGVDGRSTEGVGVFGDTRSTSTDPSFWRGGVFGEDSGFGSNSGVVGVSAYNTGVTASGVLGLSAVGTTGLLSQGSTGGVFATYGDSTYSAILQGYSGDANRFLPSPPTNATLEFSIDALGNEVIGGSLTTSGGTYARTRSTAGADVASYGARSATPTLEDFGQGTLTRGAGHVSLDRTFASTIDTHSYLVFITPHGDSHSLYTTALTGEGFDVRESERGRSSLAFDYRIVGRPLDMAAAGHLPAVATLPQTIAAIKMQQSFNSPAMKRLRGMHLPSVPR